MSAARRTLTDLVLTLAAVLGVLCVLFALAGVLLGYGVVMFRTGSMAPSIPAGSAALVHRVPAEDLRVGDVVTVDRPGQLPITHRVVSTTTVPGSDLMRDLVLRGDANTADDPAPYRVDSARRVIGSVPGIASTIAWWQQPMVFGPLTALLAGGVVWALWPRPDRRVDECDLARGAA